VNTQLRILWAAVAVLLVGGLVGAVVRDEETLRRATPSPTAPPPSKAELDRVVAELQRFVEGARGLAFKQPVAVTLLDDAAFRARLAEDEDEEEDKEEVETTTKVLQALKLLEDDVDLEEEAEALFGDAVLGFYDPEKNDLVVRGVALTPGVRSTLVHELTHALQDQWFELDRDDLDERDDEASTAFDSLVEGDAVRIEQAYTRTLPPETGREAFEETSGDYDDVPKVLLQSIAFPYEFGPRFVGELVELGGNPRVDEAFRHLPETSEQIMHPQAYLQGDGLAVVPEPSADGEVFDRGVVGEFGLVLILDPALDGPELGRAVTGWDGDRYVAWEKGDEVCVRADVLMESAAHARELREALEEWADEVGDVTITGTNPVSFTSCISST
jgi:hypothetical protein